QTMSSTEHSIEVRANIPADRERVFEAWTRREQMSWYCPEEMQLIAADADVRVGGTFRASMQSAEGEVHTCYGSYLEITPNRKIVFTHQWEGDDPVETRVSVEFEERGDGTEVILRQQGFQEASEAKGHEKGWESTLRNLLKHFSTASAHGEAR